MVVLAGLAKPAGPVMIVVDGPDAAAARVVAAADACAPCGEFSVGGGGGVEGVGATAGVLPPKPINSPMRKGRSQISRSIRSWSRTGRTRFARD